MLGADEGAPLSGLQGGVSLRGGAEAERRRGEGGFVSAAAPPAGALPPADLDRPAGAADRPPAPGQTGVFTAKTEQEVQRVASTYTWR